MSKDNKQPAAPDPAAVARAQAEANRISQFGPGGNLLFGKVGPGGQFIQDTGGAASFVEESPFQQEARQTGESAALQLAQSLAPQAGNLQTASYAGLPENQFQIDWSKIGTVPTANDFSADAARVEQATFDRAMNLLRPQLDLQERRLNQSLADQGIPLGAEAYVTEQGRFADERGRRLDDLALAAVQAGRDEQSRLFNQALTSRGTQLADQLQQMSLTNQARQTGFGEQQAVRNQQLQELAALLGGAYNPTPATAFVAPGMIDVTGPINAAYQGQLAAAQQRAANQQALMGGLFGLGSAAILAA